MVRKIIQNLGLSSMKKTYCREGQNHPITTKVISRSVGSISSKLIPFSQIRFDVKIVAIVTDSGSRMFTCILLLIEEILHQLTSSLSHDLQSFVYPRWCKISTVNSSTPSSKITPRCHVLLKKFSCWQVGNCIA